MKKNIRNHAFSFVELIITITVLIILATIGFLAYQGFNTSARDSTRIAQIDNIQKSLEMYKVEKTLPIPENSVKVEMNGSLLGYQGYLGQKGLLDIGYSKGGGKDPKDDIYFTYYVSESLDKFQILTYLEKGEISFFPKVYAGNVDYTKRIPKVYGNNLGILTDISNTPIQEIASITASGKLDVATMTGIYISYFGGDDKITGTGGIFSFLDKNIKMGGVILSSCKQILEKYPNMQGQDGMYLIRPSSGGTGIFQVYCDMTTDGGGWTLITAKAKYNYSNSGYFQVDSKKKNIVFSYVRWNYVSPGQKELPLIYKVYNKQEGDLLIFHTNNVGPINAEWSDSSIHYQTTEDFSKAFSLGEKNTSGVSIDNLQIAIKYNGAKKITGRGGVETPQLNHHLRGTGWWNSIHNSFKTYLWFPSTPYVGTWRLGSETFSSSSQWLDGRSISIWIK